MRRRSWLIRKKQYSTEKVIVGTVKKSIAAMASRLCLPKTPIYVRRLELCLFFVLSRDAHFSSDTPCHRIFDRAFARCPGIREPGSPAPNRRSPTLRTSTTTQGWPVAHDVAPGHIAFRTRERRRRPDCVFSELYTLPAYTPVLCFVGCSRQQQRQTRGRAARYSFLVGLFHPLLQTGLS